MVGLSKAAEAGYERDGFAIVEGLFSADECQRICQLGETLESFRSGKLTPAMNPHRERPELLETMGDGRLMACMEQLVGGTPMGLQTQYFYGRPGTPGFARHQDNYYVEADRESFASAWLALDDVEIINGALVLYPGSHREPILDVRAIPQLSTFGQDPNANKQECVLPETYPSIDVPVKRGTVVFIHGHVAHSSHDNKSERFRRVLLMTYIKEGVAYRAGYTARRETFELRNLKRAS
ncbi:MAG TPA: phytanoyl-CoA dioxygenase family protein [Magnetospirillaceae bacterium]|jgi:ectoine hydroxylase-related dioxygenase (phytanoyl-CoA dioxygenase family)